MCTILSRLLPLASLLTCSLQAVGAGVPGQGSWETTLEARDLNGDGSTDAWYDTTLGITWLANVKAAAGSSFDSADGRADGRLSVSSAQAWLDSLNAAGFLGGSDWRLPKVAPVAGGSFSTDAADPQYIFAFDGSTDLGYALRGTGWGTSSELGHLYYISLGNPSRFEPGWSAANLNTGPFIGVDPDFVWSGTPFAPSPNSQWLLSFNDGAQIPDVASLSRLAWAVHDGDLAAPSAPVNVPLGGDGAFALLLLGSALGAARRSERTQR